MTTKPAATPSGSDLDEQTIRDSLRQVIDPEAGMDIIALGLIYRVDISADCVHVDMTMTSPACPMGHMILDDVDKVLAEVLPGTLHPEVRLVWDPPWDPSMMDEAAKRHFGWTPD
jgi:metal-sulfur cluster biosynthetic enzyme